MGTELKASLLARLELYQPWSLVSPQLFRNKCKGHSAVAKGKVLRSMADLNYLTGQLLDEVILQMAQVRGKLFANQAQRVGAWRDVGTRFLISSTG